MGALTNKELIGRGIDQLTIGLAPFVDRHMTAALGKGWLSRLEQRDAEKFGHARSYDKNDGRYLLRVVTEERDVFRKALPYPGLNLASRLREVGNKFGHNFGTAAFEPAETQQALTDMAELLRLAGANSQAAVVRQLAGGNGTAPKPRRQAPERPRRERRKPPRQHAPRRRFRAQMPRIGCGSLVLIVLITWVIWQMVKPDDPSRDPYKGKHADAAVGAQLGSYKSVELTDGYSLALLPDAGSPDEGVHDGDLGNSGGVLIARDKRIAMLGRSERGGYTACRNNTRYTASLRSGQLARGRRFCVSTDKGAVGLFVVRGVHSGSTRYVSFDITIWKGPRLKG
nr:Swt1 family HEPN domain-containing protein [Spirillospora albida]